MNLVLVLNSPHKIRGMLAALQALHQLVDHLPFFQNPKNGVPTGARVQLKSNLVIHPDPLFCNDVDCALADSRRDCPVKCNRFPDSFSPTFVYEPVGFPLEQGTRADSTWNNIKTLSTATHIATDTITTQLTEAIFDVGNAPEPCDPKDDRDFCEAGKWLCNQIDAFTEACPLACDQCSPIEYANVFVTLTETTPSISQDILALAKDQDTTLISLQTSKLGTGTVLARQMRDLALNLCQQYPVQP